jgi:flagellar hook-associated protein 2
MPSSVDGLVSGLSTSQLIAQLMQVEAAPQTKLKNKVTSENTVISAYQSVNTKMSALKTAAEALTSVTGWQSMKATASSDAITVTAGGSAIPGQLSFKVTQLAQAQVSTFKMPAAGDVADAGGITINIGDPPVSTNIPLADITANTPQGVADAVNKKGLAVRASVVTVSNGDTLLQFTSTKTGEANAFTVDGLLGDPQINVFEAVDATITVGDPTDVVNTGYTITSASNTFTNVVPGVSITAVKETTDPVTIAVSTDSGKIADKMAAMVDAANAALKSISEQSTYDAETKSGGPLLADSTTRFMTQRLLSAVSNGKADYGSFNQIGVSLDQTGQLKFDRDKFISALEADPAKVQDVVSTGLAATLAAEGKDATNVVDGSLTLAIQGRKAKVDDLNDRIADWDVRLKTRQEALQRQFTNLEVALGKLKDQAQWLAGQISSLPTAASNS